MDSPRRPELKSTWTLTSMSRKGHEVCLRSLSSFFIIIVFVTIIIVVNCLFYVDVKNNCEVLYYIKIHWSRNWYKSTNLQVINTSNIHIHKILWNKFKWSNKLNLKRYVCWDKLFIKEKKLLYIKLIKTSENAISEDHVINIIYGNKTGNFLASSVQCLI